MLLEPCLGFLALTSTLTQGLAFQGFRPDFGQDPPNQRGPGRNAKKPVPCRGTGRNPVEPDRILFFLAFVCLDPGWISRIPTSSLCMPADPVVRSASLSIFRGNREVSDEGFKDLRIFSIFQNLVF